MQPDHEGLSGHELVVGFFSWADSSSRRLALRRRYQVLVARFQVVVLGV